MFYASSFDHHDEIVLERFDTSDLKPRPEIPGSRAKPVAREHADSPVWAAAGE